jgi:putative addiction module killer protein
MEVRRYCSPDGKDEFGTWLGSLADARVKAAILVRIARIGLGNLGDFKPVGNGVLELRIDHGPGYRVYCAQAGRRLILLLVGGDKRHQQSDIKQAQEYWADWQHRRKLK